MLVNIFSLGAILCTDYTADYLTKSVPGGTLYEVICLKGLYNIQQVHVMVRSMFIFLPLTLHSHETS